MAGAARHGDLDAAGIGLAIYRELLTNGSSEREKVDASLGLTQEESTAGWHELDGLGLIRPSWRTGKMETVEPDTALIGLLARQRATLLAQRDGLTALAEAAETLMERYRPMVTREPGEVEVEVLTGAARRREFVRDFTVTVTEVISSMHPGPLPPPEFLETSLKTDRALIERNIRVRAIYGQSVNSGPRQRKYLTDLAALGAEVRLIPQVPFDLLVADEHSALTPTDPTDPEGPAVVIRGQTLIRSYLAMYEDCWLRSVPITAKPSNGQDDESELTEQHRTTLRLLANGLTDERIARTLGVSLRTVSRLVSEVMRYLDAESRFQAGVLAAANDLI
ncbi:regulatory protein, luxR family [Actinacidiphila yanglinensis]|uniref:Regulatory protein, luxR family n=1 Tax=Actinacidiphila yanglinensis TaxID=310779 RepID=A0A1H5VL70_9ACTN|nr:LuxR C-terminal-related transcriptional regulator [Actinacidiphila yanglinensis]SEF88062.1 regulatory protein, luxR family [Actinacidiphila yanglinensis]